MAATNEQTVDYFAPHCNSEKTEFIILNIMALSIFSFALCFVSFIGFGVIRKIRRQQKFRRSLKYTLYAAILTTLLGLCNGIVTSIFCIGPRPRFDGAHFILPTLYGIGSFAYQILMLLLLINFFLRLDVTFGESALAMSTTKRRTFVTFLCVEAFLFVCTIIMYAAVFWAHDIIVSKIIANCVYLLFWSIYALISFALVREFNNNLITMAKFSVGSAQDISNLELNQVQQQQVNLSAKYLALYAVAAISTGFFQIYFVACAISPYGEPNSVTSSLVVIDVCVNICCLILSYGVMNSAYTKYCHRLDGCFRDWASGSMKRRVSQILTEKASANRMEEAQIEESDAIILKSLSVSTDGSTSL